MPLPRLQDQPRFLLTLSAFFWAANAVVGRAIVNEIPPTMLAQIRWTLASAIIVPIAWPTLRRELPVVRRHLPMILLISLIGITVFNTMQYWSLQYTTAINVSVLQSSSPLLIGLWSLMLWRDPLSRGQMAGIAVSLFGVLFIVSGGHLERLARLTLNTGDISMLVAIADYALYSALLRKRPPLSPVGFLAVTLTIGAALLVPFTIAEYAIGARITGFGAGGAAAILYVAVFPSVLAYACYNRGVQMIGANSAGPFFHLIPLFGSGLAILFLGERLGWHHVVGGVLIIGGVFVAGRGRRPSAGGNRVAAAERSQ